MPLKLQVADWERLSQILPDCEESVRKAQTLAQRTPEHRDIQLSRFVSFVDIEKLFLVDCSSSLDRKYLVWRSTGEEAVLHFQGILSQVCVTPFTPESPGRLARPGSIRQFIQVVSTENDHIFQQVWAAEKAIQKFMWQYGGNPEKLVLQDSTFGGLPALYADSKLLTALSQLSGNAVPIHADMEERSALSHVCQDTKHRYTEDNVVGVFEWYLLDNDTMSLQARDSGRVLRPGHLVDVGVTFRLLFEKRGEPRFITKLDSITIIDRAGAEKLDDLKRNL